MSAFFTSVRVRPCRPLARRESSGRLTRTSEPATSTLTLGLCGKCIFPFGPSTLMSPSTTETLTFSGIFTGTLPTRDMGLLLLPDGADELAAHLLLACLAVDHHALRRGEDGNAHAVQDARDRLAGHVAAQAGLRHALDVADCRFTIRAVLQHDGDGPLNAILVPRVVLDVALALQDLGDAHLEAGGRDDHLLVPSRRRVADARQHVANGIGHGHEVSLLPARLDDAGDLALQRTVAEADAAHLELAQERAGTAAQRAAIVLSHRELQLALRLGHLGKLRHSDLLAPLLAERHAEQPEERAALLVVPGARHHRDVQSLDLLDLVVVDLGEDDLLAHAQRVVALAVEGLGRDALEVADAWQRDAHEPVEELVGAVAPQRDHGADGLALAQLEVRDRLARLGYDGLLAADLAELLHRRVDDLAVVDGLSEAHVDDDLLQTRRLHGVLEAELLHERSPDLLVVSQLQTCSHPVSLPSPGSCLRRAMRFPLLSGDEPPRYTSGRAPLRR